MGNTGEARAVPFVVQAVLTHNSVQARKILGFSAMNPACRSSEGWQDGRFLES